MHRIKKTPRFQNECRGRSIPEGSEVAYLDCRAAYGGGLYRGVRFCAFRR